jgi:hypothetical protein
MIKKLAKRDDPAQSLRFIGAARELGTDNDPERFKETVRKMAKAPPAKHAPHPLTSLKAKSGK